MGQDLQYYQSGGNTPRTVGQDHPLPIQLRKDDGTVYDSGNPFPVTATVPGTVTVTVSGTVTCDTELPAAAALSDATANPTCPQVGAAGENWNDTTAKWERGRNNTELTLLASAARTAEASSPDQVNYNGRVLTVLWNCTVYGSAGAATITFEVKDPISGNYGVIWSVAPNSTGLYRYIAGPGVSENGGAHGHFATPVGRTWRLRVTPPDANSNTYSLSATLGV